MSGDIFCCYIWGSGKGREHLAGRVQDATSTGQRVIQPDMSVVLKLGAQSDTSPLLYCHLSWNFKNSHFLTCSLKGSVFLLILLLMLNFKTIFFLNIKIIHAYDRDFRVFRKVQK